ncbi:MAG: methyltransferase domain-containing protein [Chloroflexota bacterium]
MTHDEMVALIRRGVMQTGGTWADFGAGGGNFTRALRDVTGESAVIYAVDKNRGALSPQNADVHTISADFTRPIPELPLLDGLLVANALHFVRRQRDVIEQLAGYLRPGGSFIVVEYEVNMPRSFIPNPLPYSKFAQVVAAETGLDHIRQVGSRTSPRNGMTMYTAHANKLETRK